MEPIVSKRWLLARMYEPDLVIVDCRFELGQPKAGRAAYDTAHIPGAVYLDLEQDLSAPVTTHGGRHPLPAPDELAARFARAGIGNATRVVAYDDQGGMNASRLWWLLRWLGHDEVYVMDEGFAAWQAGGYPVTSERRTIVPAAFTPSPGRTCWPGPKTSAGRSAIPASCWWTRAPRIATPVARSRSTPRPATFPGPSTGSGSRFWMTAAPGKARASCASSWRRSSPHSTKAARPSSTAAPA